MKRTNDIWCEIVKAWLNLIGAKDVDPNNGVRFSWCNNGFIIGIRDDRDLWLGSSTHGIALLDNIRWHTKLVLVDPLNPDFDPVPFFEPFKLEMEKQL